MRRLSFAFFSVLASYGSAFAWGDLGHKVICDIAFRVALPETRSEIRRLIQNDTQYDFFRDACIYPDHPRKRAPDHFINVPRNFSRFTSDNTCPTAERCLLTAIQSDLAVLSSQSANDAKKLESLKFLGHWVGDIHQPLHVSFEDDRGGNEEPVEGGCSGNLHAAWDTCLVLNAVSPDPSAAATDILNSLTPAMKEQWTQASNPRDWATESFAITKVASTKYCVQQGSSCNRPIGDITIDSEYIQANTPIIRQQLTKAGVRLAHMLNTALAGD
jgi:S1/P1 Nuclease